SQAIEKWTNPSGTVADLQADVNRLHSSMERLRQEMLKLPGYSSIHDLCKPKKNNNKLRYLRKWITDPRVYVPGLSLPVALYLLKVLLFGGVGSIPHSAFTTNDSLKASA